MVYESVAQRKRREKHSSGSGKKADDQETEETKKYIICTECRHVSENEERYKAHFTEPRHVNNYRDLAYKEPKKRQVWLKVWFSKLEEAETLNGGFFEVEEEDNQLDMMTPPASAEAGGVSLGVVPCFNITPPDSDIPSARHRKSSTASSSSYNSECSS